MYVCMYVCMCEWIWFITINRCLSILLCSWTSCGPYWWRCHHTSPFLCWTVRPMTVMYMYCMFTQEMYIDLIYSYRSDGSFQRRRYSNEEFTVTLPEGTDLCDIGTLTIWCRPFRAIFTRIEIPQNIFVSNYVPTRTCLLFNQSSLIALTWSWLVVIPSVFVSFRWTMEQTLVHFW